MLTAALCTTPFLERLDPGLQHHLELGRQAALYVFKLDPSGQPPDELLERAEADVSRMITARLRPLGADRHDILIAFLAAAHGFGRHYGALVDALSSDVGGRA